MTLSRKTYGILTAIICPLAIWAVTTGFTALTAAWHNKESVTAHQTDMATVKADRAQALDSIYRALDATNAKLDRLTDIACDGKENRHVCQ